MIFEHFRRHLFIWVPRLGHRRVHNPSRSVTSNENLAGRRVDLIPGATNQHVSVDADGNPCVDLNFVEEPLGLPGSEGYGWPQLEFGDHIGPDSRYGIKRKLGWGGNSSTWLAYDTRTKEYLAMKALKGHSTELSRQGRTWEPEALHRVSATPNDHCLRLLDEFTHPGKGNSGDHLCFVTPVYGGDVKTLWSKHKNFPLPLAKRMLLHTLRGIAHIHGQGVIHTDLKHDNIFFTSSLSAQDIDAVIASDPSRRNPPEASLEGLVSSAVTQPLPTPTLDDALKRTYLLADLGSAALSNEPKEDEVTAVALRPPEIFLQFVRWNEKVDIWTFGCLIFEFITGRSLFKHKKIEKDGKVIMDETNCQLHQMACFIGAREFPAEVLQYSRLASQYFDPDCTFKHKIPIRYEPFEVCIRNYKVLDREEDIKSTAAIVRRCLQLNPDDRPAAQELLNDPWFDGVD